MQTRARALTTVAAVFIGGISGIVSVTGREVLANVISTRRFFFADAERRRGRGRCRLEGHCMAKLADDEPAHQQENDRPTME